MTSTNYVSWPFNRTTDYYRERDKRPDLPPDQVPGDKDFARGKTPEEYYQAVQSMKAGWPSYLARNFESIIYDNYNYESNGGPQFYAHRGGFNRLFYDGHVACTGDHRRKSD